MVRRLLQEADGLELGPRERARSLWLSDAFQGGSAQDPAPVHALVETATAMTAEGDSDLALSLLSAAARRCYWGDLSGPRAAGVLDAADRAGAAPDDPRLLFIQAMAAPLERGAVVLGQLARLDLPDDLRALPFLGGRGHQRRRVRPGLFPVRGGGSAAARPGSPGRARPDPLDPVLVGDLGGRLPGCADIGRGRGPAGGRDRPAAVADAGLDRPGHHRGAAWRSRSRLRVWTARIEHATLRWVPRAIWPSCSTPAPCPALGRGRHDEAYDQLRGIRAGRPRSSSAVRCLRHRRPGRSRCT